MFPAPGQVIGNEPEGELHQPYGKALIFHPDLIKGTSLGGHFHEYSYFSYQSNEALHVSERERDIITNYIDIIHTEITQNIDKHTRKLIVSNLEILLDYCLRFYERQFISREEANRGTLEQFESILSQYIHGDDLPRMGFPSVSYFADKLHLSVNYFGDLVKKETGKQPWNTSNLCYWMRLRRESLINLNRSVRSLTN